MKLTDFLLKPPKRFYKSKEDQLNFIFAWNMANITLWVILFLLFLFSLTQISYVVPCFIALSIVVVFQYLLFTVKDYRKVAFWFSFSAMFFFGILMFTKFDVLHLVEYVWMFMIISYAYTISGKRSGNILLFFGAAILVVHTIFFLEKNIEVFQSSISNYFLISTSLVVVLGFLSVGYLKLQHIKIKSLVEDDLKKSNEHLNRQNELIQSQKEEKEVMLKEIHHRVKNNLQIISSLLRLQSNQIENPEVNQILEENVNRISSIALIHEKIYQSSNLAKINYEKYLKSLIKEILSSLGSKKDVSYSIESNLDKIGNRTIVPMALIFNELLTNSVKHAFENVDDPKIQVKIQKLDDKKFTLNYSDNGVWKSKKVKSNSIGLDLIETFTEQLDGTVERITENGRTEYRFELSIID